MNLQDAGVVLHERIRSVLNRLSRSRTEEPRLVERATIVLNGVAGMSHAEHGRLLGIDRQRSRRWTVRWIEESGRLTRAAADADTSDRQVEKLVFDALADERRSGTPPKFTAEQMTRLIALACERPEASNIPVNRLTPAELAREAVKRGIVESISGSRADSQRPWPRESAGPRRHLDRIMKRR